MILYLNNRGEIHAVGSTERTDLTKVELDETAIGFPFCGWSYTRICCYRIEIENGYITMMTPYVPTHMMSALESLESRNAELEAIQLEQDEMILENNFNLLVLQEGIGDIV